MQRVLQGGHDKNKAHVPPSMIFQYALDAAMPERGSCGADESEGEDVREFRCCSCPGKGHMSGGSGAWEKEVDSGQSQLHVN